MKKYLAKVLLIVFPVLTILGIIEFTLREKDSSYSRYKRDYIQKHADEIEGFIMGPSHIWSAINPRFLNYKVAPLSLPGSSINIDMLMYEAVRKKVTKKPKFIIYDLSQGYLENYNGINWIAENNLYYYFKVNSRIEVRSFFYLKYPLWKYYKNRVPLNYNGWGFETDRLDKNNHFKKFNYEDSIIVKSQQFRRTIAKHNHTNEKVNQESEEHLNKLVAECKKEGIKLIFISPPKFHLYNKNLMSEHFERRQSFLDGGVIDNETVFFINFEKLYEYEAEYYYDANHMNFEGSKAFTEKMNTVLKDML